MKKRFYFLGKGLIGVISALVFLTVPFFASAQVDFGGVVTAMVTCDEGELLYVSMPLTTVPTPFMWFEGELPFLMYVPPHIGQELLGEAGITPVDCDVGPETVGAGLPILFHGESL